MLRTEELAGMLSLPDDPGKALATYEWTTRAAKENIRDEKPAG